MALPSTGAISFSAIQTEFGGSNPIGLNEYYAGGAYVPAGTTGTNGAVPSSGAICVNKFHGTQAAVIGQQAYTTAGTYTWVAPSGVTSVSVVAVGAGGWPKLYCCGCVMKGGGGGGLGYKNNYAVTPGASYTVVVGAGGMGGVGNNGGDSYFVSTCNVRGGGAGGSGNYAGRCGGTYTGTGGGNGGNGAIGGIGDGGGGAGGYSGNGGCGKSTNQVGCGYSGAGGGGGGGWGGGGGGGVGILGQGSNGAGGANQAYFCGGNRGRGGSGGSDGQGTFVDSCNLRGGSGGAYGGGSGMYNCRRGPGGAVGAVRIIWPGTTRSFPSTCTGNL